MNNNITEDILIELFNISVGKSASVLSEIINKKIVLSVPDLEIIDLEENAAGVDNYLPEVLNGTIMASTIGFNDALAGKASLIFPADKMREFINLCLNEDGGGSVDNLNFTDIDFDVVKEIGNIVLNSVIGEIGNFLQFKLCYTLSEIDIFDREEFQKSLKNGEFKHLLLLYITFKIDDSEIAGAIIINLTLSSLSELLNRVSAIEDSFYG